MRTHKIKFLSSCLALMVGLAAGPALSQNAGPSSDESVPPPAAIDSNITKTPAGEAAESSYSAEEIADAAGAFFGKTSGAMGKVVERIFREQGRPLGFIRGDEVSAAAGIGLRYGKGTLVMKDGQERQVYWQGPSFGVDAGGNASKVFTLVYNLENPDGLYRRYPGVEGSAFFIAGVAVTYQRAEGVTLAPMRSGVGFRGGVNAGYTAYSKKRRWFPL